MLRKRIETLLIYIPLMIVGTIVGWYVQVLLCDVWHLPLAGCR